MTPFLIRWIPSVDTFFPLLKVSLTHLSRPNSTPGVTKYHLDCFDQSIQLVFIYIRLFEVIYIKQVANLGLVIKLAAIPSFLEFSVDWVMQHCEEQGG